MMYQEPNLYQPTPYREVKRESITLEKAKKLLRLYLKERNTRITEWGTTTYWDYSDNPFWAINAQVMGFGERSLYGVYGFHIKPDKVALVCKYSGDGE